MDEPTWPPETLESIIRLSLRPIEDRAYSADEVRTLLLEAALTAVFNDRAAVMRELDNLEREFTAAGRANTAMRIRESAKKIDARFRS